MVPAAAPASADNGAPIRQLPFARLRAFPVDRVNPIRASSAASPRHPYRGLAVDEFLPAARPASAYSQHVPNALLSDLSSSRSALRRSLYAPLPALLPRTQDPKRSPCPKVLLARTLSAANTAAASFALRPCSCQSFSRRLPPLTAPRYSIGERFAATSISTSFRTSPVASAENVTLAVVVASPGGVKREEGLPLLARPRDRPA